MPRHPYIPAVAFLVGIVAIPAALALSESYEMWVDEEYRSCVAEAIDIELGEKIDAQRGLNDRTIEDLEEYRSAIARAWEISDDRERRDEIRNADRELRDRTRDSKRVYSDAVRDLRRERSDRERACRDRRNEQKDFGKNMCLSTDDCRSGQICTTEQGECESACPPGSDFCTQVCAGTCVRASSSRSSSSQSSSIRSSSSRSSRSSSRSSRYRCEPHMCPDGRQYPSCTVEGHPINYFRDPCRP